MTEAAAGAPSGDSDRYASFTAMRVAHTTLLRQYRTEGTSAALMAAAEQFLSLGCATGALIDTEDDRNAAQSLLDYWTAVLCRAGRAPTKAVLDDFDPSLSPSLADRLCPYVGLESFQESTCELFFGRRRVLEDLLSWVRGRRLVAVLGPSGSGKSSVVLAGLITELKASLLPGSSRWRYYNAFFPGPDPIASLIDEVRTSLPSGVPPPANAQDVLRAVEASGEEPAVFVVDQFEEVFTLCESDEKRAAFTDALLALSSSPTKAHVVILTMRSDFEPHVAMLPALQERFEQAAYRLPPPTAAELRETIEKPAELVGLKFEQGVVDRLVKEILGEPAGLPLLQFTLLKLWENREGNRVTLDAYRRVGGGRLALANAADQLYDSVIPEDQVTLKRILLRMVRPATGLEVTSNRISRESLYAAGPRDRIDRVLDRLIAARLVRQTPGPSPGSEQVEVAHEALVRNWPRLVEWVEEDRVILRKRLRLTAAAEQWRSHGKDPGGLLGGSLLDEAGAYDDLNVLESEFVEASRRAEDDASRKEEEIRRHELEQTRALAAEQKRRADEQAAAAATLKKANRRLQGLTLLASLLLIVAIAGWVHAELLHRQVEETLSRLQSGRGVVVETETASAASPADLQSADDESAAPRPMEKKGFGLGSLKAKTAAGPTAAAGGTHAAESVSPKPGTATADTTAGASSSSASASYAPTVSPNTQVEVDVPESTLWLDALRLRASRTPTGKMIEGTELPAYSFRLWVEGSRQDLARIRNVDYEFNHPTFRQKRMTGRDPTKGFAVGYTGWGCLSSVKVHFNLIGYPEQWPIGPSGDPSVPHRDFEMCAAMVDQPQAK